MNITVPNTSETGCWRLVFELSGMQNNDERVYHSKRFLNDDAVKRVEANLGSEWDKPHLRFQRPVFASEIQAGLDTSYSGNEWDEKPPRETVIIDGAWKLLAFAQQWQALQKEMPDNEYLQSPATFIADYIADNYYDCMSADCPTGAMMMCRMLVQHYNLDLDTPVYPTPAKEHMDRPKDKNGTRWLTLLDWMTETSATEELPPQIRGLLGD